MRLFLVAVGAMEAAFTIQGVKPARKRGRIVMGINLEKVVLKQMTDTITNWKVFDRIGKIFVITEDGGFVFQPHSPVGNISRIEIRQCDHENIEFQLSKSERYPTEKLSEYLEPESATVVSRLEESSIGRKFHVVNIFFFTRTGAHSLEAVSEEGTLFLLLHKIELENALRQVQNLKESGCRVRPLLDYLEWIEENRYQKSSFTGKFFWPGERFVRAVAHASKGCPKEQIEEDGWGARCTGCGKRGSVLRQDAFWANWEHDKYDASVSRISWIGSRRR